MKKTCNLHLHSITITFPRTVNAINFSIKIFLKLYYPFLWIWFHCLKAAESLKGGTLLLTTKFPGIPCTHLLEDERMKV